MQSGNYQLLSHLMTHVKISPTVAALSYISGVQPFSLLGPMDGAQFVYETNPNGGPDLLLGEVRQGLIWPCGSSGSGPDPIGSHWGQAMVQPQSGYTRKRGRGLDLIQPHWGKWAWPSTD